MRKELCVGFIVAGVLIAFYTTTSPNHGQTFVEVTLACAVALVVVWAIGRSLARRRR